MMITEGMHVEIAGMIERARDERALAGRLAELIVGDLLDGREIAPERFERYALQRASAEDAEDALAEATS